MSNNEKNAFEKFSNALKSRKVDAPKKSTVFRTYKLEKPKETSSNGKPLDKKSWASLSAQMSYKTGGVNKYQGGGNKPKKLVEVNGQLVAVSLDANEEEVQQAYQEQYVKKAEPAPQQEPAPQPRPRPAETSRPQPRPQPSPQPTPRPTPQLPAREPEPAPLPVTRDTVPEDNNERPTIRPPKDPDLGVPVNPSTNVAPPYITDPQLAQQIFNEIGDGLDRVGSFFSDNLEFLRDGIMRNKDLSEEISFLPEGSNLGMLRPLTDAIGFTVPDDYTPEDLNLHVNSGPLGPEVPPELYPDIYGTTSDGATYLTNFGHNYTDWDWDYEKNKPERTYWSYRNQYLNENGFQFVPFTHKQGLRQTNQDGIHGIQGIAHFLIDADPTVPRTEEQANQYLSRLDRGDYVPVFHTEDNGRITLKYVNTREEYDALNSKETWQPLANLRQFKASDVDWDVNDTPFGGQHGRSWHRGITNYKLKDGTDTYIPWKRHHRADGKLGRFNGATVTYLFNDPSTGKLVVRDFTGKAQEIRDEVGKIQERFGISPEDITIGMYDAGSYSAKPFANDGDFVGLDRYSGFNTQETSGAGLAIPSDYMPSPDLVFDSNAWKTGGPRSMKKYLNKKLKRK